ncbi:hypothetical protein [Phycicoccus avicenniae]|uniref:hypothetical protein n=1 Tax=Phycicoccus avicenniae TaxID=2828860 RepID=UPI003D268568
MLKDDDPLEKAKRLTCYTNEVTAGLKAETALRDLTALDIPSSMQGLVSDTSAALQGVVDTDLESACGEAMSEPSDSKQCDDALGARFASYVALASELERWSPYL